MNPVNKVFLSLPAVLEVSGNGTTPEVSDKRLKHLEARIAEEGLSLPMGSTDGAGTEERAPGILW
jgi:hypothetical protein